MSNGLRGRKILALLETELNNGADNENCQNNVLSEDSMQLPNEINIEIIETCQIKSLPIVLGDIINDNEISQNNVFSQDNFHLSNEINIENIETCQVESLRIVLSELTNAVIDYYDGDSSIINHSEINDLIPEVKDLVDNDPNDEDYVPNESDQDSGNDTQLENENQMPTRESPIPENLLEDRNDHISANEGRKRSIRPEPENWAKSRSKRLRKEGKPYTGYSRSKEGKVSHNVPRKGREIGPSCTSKECRRVKTKQCSEITQQQRVKVFAKFWNNMNWDQRKIYVINHVTQIVPNRMYTKSVQSRRKCTFQYFLTVDNNKMQVCKNMFLQTLNLGEYCVHDWIRKGNDGMSTSSDISKIRKKPSTCQMKIEDKTFLELFFTSLPKLPSHYGRINSSKLHLETTIRTMNQLFKLYIEKCAEVSKTPLSRALFSNMFYAMNLSIHRIKKDKCDLCTQHEVGQLSDEKWGIYIKKKDKARDEKKKDKDEISLSQKGRVLTIDLQAVKVCPFVQASAFFFKTKLSCHNFTVYDLITHRCTCFWFTETETDLTASTFASCIIEYLSTHCQNESGPIIIYSDGCTYQNRNQIMSNALLGFAVDNNVEIIQKFLEVGHTQMECDSVHSCIERKLKGRDIYLPSDYIRITQEARTKPFPYEVRNMQYSDFKNYTVKKYQRYASIRPGKVVNDPVVTDIRALKHSPNGKIYYKLQFDDNWLELPQRPKSVSKGIIYPPMYNAKRPIKKTK